MKHTSSWEFWNPHGHRLAVPWLRFKAEEWFSMALNSASGFLDPPTESPFLFHVYSYAVLSAYRSLDVQSLFSFATLSLSVHAGKKPANIILF